jgi:transposase-like protein
MSKQEEHRKKDPATKITYQGYSHGFKKTILAEIENGQISINQAAKKYGVGRTTIQKWMNKMGNFDKKLREMGGNSAKQEIQRLKQKIRDLETQKDILETAIEIVEEEYGVDVKKKFLPESLKNTLRKIRKR